MKCSHVERHISDSMDRPLSAQDEAEVRSHMAGCSRCREFSAQVKGLSASLQPLASMARESGAAQRAVAQFQATGSAGSRCTARNWAAGAALSAAGLAAAALLLFGRGEGTGPTPGGSGKLPSVIATEAGQGTKIKGLERQPFGAPAPPSYIPIVERRNTPRLTEGSSSYSPSSLVPAAGAMKDDIQFVNAGAAGTYGRWARLPASEERRIQRELDRTLKTGDSFIDVPFPRIAGLGNGGLAAAKREYLQEKAVVDPRLNRRMTLAAKAVSFSDLCKQWTDETGIEFSAARSVADDKVTIFCKDKPLRDLMRQITQVLGFTWRRAGENGVYHYEIFQDLRSQLMEEELRNKDRNEALIALDKEMERYQKYAQLTPEQARAMAQTASPEDKKLLESLGGTGYAAAHLYGSLSGDQLSALRSGQSIEFASSPKGGENQLPEEMKGSVLQGLHTARIQRFPDGRAGISMGDPNAKGEPVTTLTGANVRASMKMQQNDLGQMELLGYGGFSVTENGPMGENSMAAVMGDTMASAMSPSVRDPQNAKKNAKTANNPAVGRSVSVEPEQDAGTGEKPKTRKKVTIAEVLEAIHKSSGMDIVADGFTRLYPAADVSVKDQKLFDALNKVADRMRLNWTLSEGFLEFRSTSFFNDRLKEVPNRLLSRWASAMKENGGLRPAEMMEIASLTDAQLDSRDTAEGAKLVWGISQWELGAGSTIRPHWRFLAAMSPQLRKAAMSDKGITFGQLPYPLQQKYVDVTLGNSAQRANALAEDFAPATLRVKVPEAPKSGAEANPDVRASWPDIHFVYEYGGGNLRPTVRNVGYNSMSVGAKTSNAEDVLRQTSERKP